MWRDVVDLYVEIVDDSPAFIVGLIHGLIVILVVIMCQILSLVPLLLGACVVFYGIGVLVKYVTRKLSGSVGDSK
jgi:uncharacterized protein (DUF983 family)